MNPVDATNEIDNYSAMADSLYTQGKRKGIEDMRIRVLDWANDNAKVLEQAGLMGSFLKAIL